MFSSRVSPGALARVTWIHADGLAALQTVLNKIILYVWIENGPIL
jgi:hypothetical protein